MTHVRERARPMTLRTVLVLFALSFALTWGLGALLFVFPDTVTGIFGEVGFTNPLFLLAVYAPGIVGTLLVWRHHGLRGLGRFFGRLALGRMPAAWWAFLIVGLPGVFTLGAALKGTLGDPFPFDPWTGVLPALLLALVVGPIEELGWRGVALPLLQRRFAPLGAGLILGLVWAAWHVPAFLSSGTPQSGGSFPAFFLGVVALSVIMTPMFNASGGSLLIPVLFHAQVNGPAWPDAQPWDTVVLLVVAVVVVWANRRTMLVREGAATDVVPPPRHAGRGPEDARGPSVPAGGVRGA